jgi:hypothetical protein
MLKNSTSKALLFGIFVAVGVAPHAALATPITGTDSIGYFNVSVAGNGTNLNGATSIFSTTGTGQTQAVGGGDLSVIPAGTDVTFNTLFPLGVDGGNGGAEPAFSFTLVGFGTFTATADPLLESSNATGQSEGDDYYVLGEFVPGAGLSAFTAGPASFDVSFTETFGTTSTSYSGSGTFASPPATPPSIPEPATIALFGAGLIGLGVMGRSRKS